MGNSIPQETFGRIKDQPIVEVSRVEDEQSVIESCPICGESHYHGFKSLPAITATMSAPSHRIAHCSSECLDNAFDGYYLIYTEDTNGVEIAETGDWEVV